MPTRSVTCTAPVNIAFIKYWGKRDENLITPINDSFSITLSTATFCTTTEVALSADFADDTLELNGENVEIAKSSRLVNVINAIRLRADPAVRDLKIRATSHNNFPTAAGMASSASGYCCLVFALAKAYRIEGNVSDIARVGSGSACRSMFGGFVQWTKGEKDDGSDSVALQRFDHTHWPEMDIFVCVVESARKETPSTAGMQQTVETSEILKTQRLGAIPGRIEAVTECIRNKDFAGFATITMKDSDELRAICMDTKPPIDYWNEGSHAVRQHVIDFNEKSGSVRVAYTFDAGPNPFLFMERKTTVEFMTNLVENCKVQNAKFEDAGLEAELKPVIEAQQKAVEGGKDTKATFQQLFQCQVGSGPAVIKETEE